MKRVNSIMAIILLMIAGCGERRQPIDDLVIVDVTRSYPQKELILQDFMDVEYIPLETGGEFYTQGVVLDIGKEIIVVRNRVSDGDIFLFDRNGKGLRKINRRGQDPKNIFQYQRYQYTVSNEDYTTPKTLEFSLGLFSNMNNEIAYLQRLEADDLFEANEKGQLKGKLKEIAAKLDEEDNPVIMLVKHKK